MNQLAEPCSPEIAAESFEKEHKYSRLTNILLLGLLPKPIPNWDNGADAEIGHI